MSTGDTDNPFDQLTPEEALAELQRRGPAMSEDEREAYLRRAVQAVDSVALADRLLARVPRSSPDDDSDDEDSSEDEIDDLIEVIDKTG